MKEYAPSNMAFVAKRNGPTAKKSCPLLHLILHLPTLICVETRTGHTCDKCGQHMCGENFPTPTVNFGKYILHALPSVDEELTTHISSIVDVCFAHT